MDNEENIEVETLDDASDNYETGEADIEVSDDSPEEVEVEVEVDATDPIEDLIANIENGDFVSSNGIFNSMVNDKLADALENEKISIASRLYGSKDETETEVESEEEIEYDEAV